MTLNLFLIIDSVRSTLQSVAAPHAIPVDPHARSLAYNPSFDAMYGPQMGPANLNQTQQQRADRNTLSGMS